MAYKKNFFKDKTVVTLSTISVIAAAALIGGMALDTADTPKENSDVNIVDLNETDTTNQYSALDNYYESLEDATDNEVSEQPTAMPEEPTDTVDQVADEDENSSDISVNSPANSLNFSSNSILTWPVDGNIVIDYDMENTVYFPTLDLYKCSDAICIQSDVGTPVYASNNCVVSSISTDDEIGLNITADLGNGYVITYGQLKDIVVDENDILEEGDLIGYVAEPTKYYSLEGTNLYVKLTENGTPVNPLDYLNYE